MRFTRNDALNKRCRRLSGKRRLFAPELFAFVNKDTPCSWKYPKSSSPVFLKQALYFVRSGAVDHERGGASRDRENHLWDAHDAHPLLRTARSSGHRMATVIEVNAVFSTGSRPALKTMGLPDRGWSVGSTKSEQLHDVKSVITVTFACVRP